MSGQRKGGGSVGSRSLLQSWGRYVAGVDDGQWSTMIKPGARGYGVIPWNMSISDCACKGHAQFTHGDDPLMATALVTWESALDTSDNARKDVDEQFTQIFDPEYRVGEMTMPLVYVTPIAYPDDNDPVTLENQGLTAAGMFEEAFDGYRYKGERMLLPAWSVTPVISGTSWHAWVKESHAHWDDMKWPRWYGRFGVNEYDDSFHGGGCLSECVCGINDMFAAFIRDVDVVDLDAGVNTDRQLWEETCHYAWDRWRQGWKMCFNAAAFTGDAPSTDLGYHYSPFWRTDALSLSAPELHVFVDKQPSYELVNMIPRERYRARYARESLGLPHIWGQKHTAA